MKEQNILKTIMIAVSMNCKSVLFRNNTGLGWAGKASSTNDGGKYIKDARPLRAGLTVGSSDLIGWTTITVDESMIGQQIAVFTAIEVKNSRGKASKDQIRFLERLKNDGGISTVARSAEQAVETIQKFCK